MQSPNPIRRRASRHYHGEERQQPMLRPRAERLRLQGAGSMDVIVIDRAAYSQGKELPSPLKDALEEVVANGEAS